MTAWNTNEIQSRGGLPLVPNSGLGAVRGTSIVAKPKLGTVLFLNLLYVIALINNSNSAPLAVIYYLPTTSQNDLRNRSPDT